MSNFIRSHSKPRTTKLYTDNIVQTVKTLTQNSVIDDKILQLLHISEKQNSLHSPESMAIFNRLFQLLIGNHTTKRDIEINLLLGNANLNRDAIFIFYIDLVGLTEENPNSWAMPICTRLKKLISENWDDCFLVAESPSLSRRSESWAENRKQYSFEDEHLGKYPSEYHQSKVYKWPVKNYAVYADISQFEPGDVLEMTEYTKDGNGYVEATVSKPEENLPSSRVSPPIQTSTTTQPNLSKVNSDESSTDQSE